MENIARPKKVSSAEASVQNNDYIQKNMQSQINNIYDKLDELVEQINSYKNQVDTKLITGNCMELLYSTPYIDFHFDNSASDYTSRIIEERAGELTFSGYIKVPSGIVFDSNAIKFLWTGTHLALYVDNTYIGEII